MQIKYKNLGKDDDLKLVVCADASHGNLPDGGSQLGCLIELVRENKSSILSWESKEIKLVVRSSLAAETLALSNAIDDGLYQCELISGLLFNDSKSLYDAMKSKKNVTENRLRIDLPILFEFLELKVFSKLHCIDVKSQLVNDLIKRGVSSK